MSTWKTIWWFPLMEQKTGLHQLTPFVHSYGTVRRWKQWREVVLEQSEWKGNWVQTVRLPSGEEIVRRVPQ